jgi:hypothetical protein
MRCIPQKGKSDHKSDHPGVGYKLFTAGLISSMATNEMQRVYRLLKEAPDEGKIPWHWIVDETRLRRGSTRWLIDGWHIPAVRRAPRSVPNSSEMLGKSKAVGRVPGSFRHYATRPLSRQAPRRTPEVGNGSFA